MSDRLPPLPWTGGCQCGQVRYRLTRWPLTYYACHCTECQRQSASAFGLSLRVEVSSVEIEGDTGKWSRTGGSGSELGALFCPRCGVRLFHRWNGDDGELADVMNIKGGTLDQSRFVAPIGHIWTASKNAMTILPHDSLQYDRQPADDDALIAEWHRIHPQTAD